MQHNNSSDPSKWNDEPVRDYSFAHNGQRDDFDIKMNDELSDYLQRTGAHNSVGLLRLMFQVCVHEKHKNILELGTGVSTPILADCARLNNGRFLSMDIENSAHRVPDNGHSHFLQLSHFEIDTAKSVLEQVGMLPLDCLFIDGDHSVDGVTKNFEHYAPLVRKHGIIFMHNVSIWDPLEPGEGWVADSCEVPEFWHEYDFTGYEKFTFLWSNGLGMLRKL